MIISRTPFRISFFGGGTDYPVWYLENGGAVLSTSINKYCYITCRYLPPFFNYKYRIVYSQREEVKDHREINHPSVRECIEFMQINKGIEIHHDADLPARIGLGSSSSFTIGLLNVLNALKGNMVTKRQLALDAIHVEQNMIKENVGSQDQVVAAFGGFNKIMFDHSRSFTVQPITISSEKFNWVQNHLMIFFTGFTRIASDYAKEQIKQTPNKKADLNEMRCMVDEAVTVLNGKLEDLDDFGKLLHETWKIKKRLTKKISNNIIDQIYSAGLNAGALGGKLLGAGGGGFILFYVKPENQQLVKERLHDLLYVPIKFDNTGSQIIYYGPNQD